MKRNKLIPLVALLTLGWTGDLYQKWVETTFSAVDSTGIEIVFDYQYKTGASVSEASGFLRYKSAAKFLYVLGDKTVFAVDSIWKTYDSKTNQIFIHDPDLEFKNLVLRWFDEDTLLVQRRVWRDSTGTYSLQLSEGLPPIEMSFSTDEILESLKVFRSDYLLNINIYSISPIDTSGGNPFVLYVPDAFELDLRE